MKKFLIGLLVVAPCFLIFNESEHVWVNILGILWILGLKFYAHKKNEEN